MVSGSVVVEGSNMIQELINAGMEMMRGSQGTSSPVFEILRHVSFLFFLIQFSLHVMIRCL